VSAKESDADAQKLTRRGFLGTILRGAALLAVGTGAGLLMRRAGKDHLVWQIDPNKCIQCGRCETNCVLSVSAVKCTHDFPVCGYCQRCFGFYDPRAKSFETTGVDQLCPVGALNRKLVEDPYYEYTVDESLCIACGRCVKGCGQFGNGSLYLQAHHDRCLNCNECSIAAKCPADAWVRVPASRPYIIKSRRSG
jgi:Na+-translocating ferredoxin:NAD+ oxidoreductase subunit B